MRINWREAHHLYIGILLLIIGLYCKLHILATAGTVLIIDDLYQHYRHVRQPDYKSPVHQLFVWLWSNTLGKFINYPKI